MKWLLNFVYLSLLAVLSPVILWRCVRHGRYRQGWRQKLLGELPEFGADERVVWFHAVSVGEILQLRKVVDEFRAQTADQFPILVTTSTDTGFALATERFSDCVVSWFPLDFSWAVSNAFRRVNPELVVLVELELWPNFLSMASKRSVQTALINARMSDRSFRGYSRIRRIVAPVFQRFCVVAAQTQEYANRLMKLGTRPDVIKVTGSVKFDGVLSDRKNPATEQLRQLFRIQEDELVLMAGSTQAPEETMALDAWHQLRTTYPNLRLILVPRHCERFDEVCALASKSGTPLLRRSQLPTTSSGDERSVIVLDTIGELQACWGLADIAFVGGSFGARGGQNMLEPAAYGVAVLFGPNTWNFKDIVSSLLSVDGAVQLSSQDEFQSVVAMLLEDSEKRTRMSESAQEFVLSQQGAITTTVRLIAGRLGVDSSNRRTAAA